jgi:hypothetical protein
MQIGPLCTKLWPPWRLAVWVFLVVPFGEAGEVVAADLVLGGGDDAAGDSAQGGGPAAILQHGAFSHDGTRANLSDLGTVA